MYFETVVRCTSYKKRFRATYTGTIKTAVVVSLTSGIFPTVNRAWISPDYRAPMSRRDKCLVPFSFIFPARVSLIFAEFFLAQFSLFSGTFVWLEFRLCQAITFRTGDHKGLMFKQKETGMQTCRTLLCWKFSTPHTWICTGTRNW